MFGAPPQPTAAELREAEERTAMEIKGTAVACVLLYLSPFLIDYARKLV